MSFKQLYARSSNVRELKDTTCAWFARKLTFNAIQQPIAGMSRKQQLVERAHLRATRKRSSAHASHALDRSTEAAKRLLRRPVTWCCGSRTITGPYFCGDTDFVKEMGMRDLAHMIDSKLRSKTVLPVLKVHKCSDGCYVETHSLHRPRSAEFEDMGGKILAMPQSGASSLFSTHGLSASETKTLVSRVSASKIIRRVLSVLYTCAVLGIGGGMKNVGLVNNYKCKHYVCAASLAAEAKCVPSGVDQVTWLLFARHTFGPNAAFSSAFKSEFAKLPKLSESMLHEMKPKMRGIIVFADVLKRVRALSKG